MSWTDFEADSALERVLLERALPLVPTASDGSSRSTIDLAADTANVAIAVGDTLGPTPSGCVELLQIRPLLIGAAWKVLDLMLEMALHESGRQPDTKRGWSLKRKVTEAGRVPGPSQMNTQAWTALMNTYVETAQLRHSLVHRRVHTDASRALVGTDESNSPLRPLTATEQEAFVRAVLRAAEVVTAQSPDDRTEADLFRQLGALSAIHGQQLPYVSLLDALPEITVVIEASGGSHDRYTIDVPALKARQPFQGATHADLIVQFRDKPGQELRGRLEKAPDEVVFIDPDDPPDWLA